eukprot:7391863-Prymnesium_polylepis.1
MCITLYVRFYVHIRAHRARRTAVRRRSGRGSASGSGAHARGTHRTWSCSWCVVGTWTAGRRVPRAVAAAHQIPPSALRIVILPATH